MADVDRFTARTIGFAYVTNDIDPVSDEVRREFGGAITTSLRPSIFDRDVATLDPAEFAQPFQKCGNPLALTLKRARA